MINLFSLYSQMLRIRLIEEKIAEKYSEQEMRCPTHLSIGQEAVAVGVSACLSLQDKVFSTHRAHAHYLAKGGDLNRLIAELYGKGAGCTAGRGGSMHLTDLSCGFIASTAIVGNSIPLAVGQALHQKLQRKDEITVSYFGDGATEEGVFYESLNFAALKSLPVLFICENNLYSVYSSLMVRQPEERQITLVAESLGVQSYKANGNNVSEVRDIVTMAAQNIRGGSGPVLIEFATYRHREHCGPSFDDDLDYRPKEQVAFWLKDDPLLLTKKKLIETQLLTVKSHDELVKQINVEIDAAFLLASTSEYPSSIYNECNVYAT